MNSVLLAIVVASAICGLTLLIVGIARRKRDTALGLPPLFTIAIGLGCLLWAITTVASRLL